MILIPLPQIHRRLFTHDSAADFSCLTARFESSIMLLHGNRTINAKSLLGLLSIGDVRGDEVFLSIDGADEKEAAGEMHRYFGIAG